MDEQAVIKRFLKNEIESLKGTAVGLAGKLGAGKTSLTKKILENISPEFKNQVHSPTFNLCNIYDIPSLEVHHFDLYRIESEEDLFDIGIWESLESREALVFIEWIDLFPRLLAACGQVIRISLTGEKREYEILRGENGFQSL